MEKYIKVHPKFKLNGVSYTIESLRGMATNFINEGEPYEEAVGNFIKEWLNDSQSIKAHTSGSTGDPKAIKIRKIHMVSSAKATSKHFKLPEKTKALLCLPAHYIAGKMMLVRAMTQGWHLDMAQPKSNPLDNVYRRYDFCAMTPFQLDNSLSRLHLLKKLIVGGGQVPATLRSKLQDASTKIYETYGMTETVTHIAARRINSKKEDGFNVPFKTLSNVTVAQDDRGCLIIKAPMVSSDPVTTNDLVNLLTFKSFQWLGRIDNVINSGGVKLYPEQIEGKFSLIMDKPYFVAGIADESLGERLVLFVESPRDYAISKADYGLLDLAPYEIPKQIISMDSFHRTATGKIQRGLTVKKALK